MTIHLDALRFAAMAIAAVDDGGAYRRLTGDHMPEGRLRWPFRRISAATIFAFSVVDRQLIFDGLQSFMGRDEASLLKDLFEAARGLRDHRILTWGPTPLRQVQIAAMEHQLVVPMQFIAAAQETNPSPPSDLSLLMRAGSATLAEVCARLDLPMPLADRTNEPPASGGVWDHAEVSESRAIPMALLLASWLHARGVLQGSGVAQHTLVSNVAERRSSASYAPDVGRVRDRLCRQLAEQAEVLTRTKT